MELKLRPLAPSQVSLIAIEIDVDVAPKRTQEERDR